MQSIGSHVGSEGRRELCWAGYSPRLHICDRLQAEQHRDPLSSLGHICRASTRSSGLPPLPGKAPAERSPKRGATGRPHIISVDAARASQPCSKIKSNEHAGPWHHPLPKTPPRAVETWERTPGESSARVSSNQCHSPSPMPESCWWRPQSRCGLRPPRALDPLASPTSVTAAVFSRRKTHEWAPRGWRCGGVRPLNFPVWTRAVTFSLSPSIPLGCEL